MLVVLVGCSSSVIGDVDAAGLDTERVLGLSLDRADRPRRLVGPWRLDAPTQAISLADDEAGLLLVGLDDAALRQQFPSLDPAGPLTPRLGAVCDGSLQGLPQRDVAVPSDAPVLRVTPEGGVVERGVRSQFAALDALVVRGAVDPLRCERGGEAILQPLGPARVLLPADATVDGESPWSGMPSRGASVVRLDGARVLVATDRAVFLFTRGEAYRERPATARLLPESGPVFALAMVADGRGGAVVVGHHSNGELPGTGGAIWDVTLGPDGIEAVVTATVVPVQLEAVARGMDGTVVAVGVDGWVLARAAGERTFRVAARLGVDLLSITATPDPRALFVAGASDGQVFLGDAGRGLFESERLVDSARRFDVTSLTWVQASEGVQLWAGTEVGLFVRGSSGIWRPHPLDLPAALDRCAGAPDPCGRRDFVDRLTGLAADRRAPAGGQRLWVQSTGCSGLAVLDLGTGCVGHLARDDGPVARASRGATTRGLVLDEGLLTVVTEDGQVLELSVSP